MLVALIHYRFCPFMRLQNVISSVYDLCGCFKLLVLAWIFAVSWSLRLPLCKRLFFEMCQRYEALQMFCIMVCSISSQSVA